MSRDFDDLNPYASPSAPIKPPPEEPGPTDLSLFLLWEKLRVLYNAILGLVTVVTLLVVPPRSRSLSDLFLSLAFFCFAANVCFCLGPVIDGYARLLGMRHNAVTVVIFSLGTGFAVLLALFAVHSFNMAAFD